MIKKRKLTHPKIEYKLPPGETIVIHLGRKKHLISREIAVYIFDLVQENYALRTRLPGKVSQSNSYPVIAYPEVVE